MSYQQGRQPLDANGRTLVQLGMTVANSKILSASGATANVPVFGITGSVLINALYGVVTTALGNNTAASWRLNDQTAQIAITSVGGTTISAAPTGSVIEKVGLAAAALTLKSSVAGAVLEPTTLETLLFSPFQVTQKTGGVATNIEFNYTTSDTPTSGAITFYVGYTPLSSDGAITAL